MSQEIREFVAGDKIAITTTLEHEANIAGITVSYHSENEPHASYGALVFSQGSTDIGRSPYDKSVSLPGPYLNGEVTLEATVSPMQRRGRKRYSCGRFPKIVSAYSRSRPIRLTSTGGRSVANTKPSSP